MTPAHLIQIAEDSPSQATILQCMLQANGFKVSAATNGREALESVRSRRPAIVVSDVLMPEMDGYELCRSIKSEESLKDIPVILLTALTDPEDIIKGLNCGANHFVTKPYSEEFLIQRLNYLIENRESHTATASDAGVEIFFSGYKYVVKADRVQILDLLFSTFENAVMKSRELEKANRKLLDALETIKTLRGLVPICACCKKIRNDHGYWQQVEVYVEEHSEAEFSHGICPECMRTLYPQYAQRVAAAQ